MYLFSKSTLGFYPENLLEDYIKAGSLPDDVKEVADEVRNKFIVSPPPQKKLGADENGDPVWVDWSKEEFLIGAETKKKYLIEDVVSYINSRQWPGKAGLGRLKDDEKNRYILWLDYLDALDALDLSTAPDIEWPEEPAK